MTRNVFDKICQRAIRILMLTGVAFSVSACYGPPPERRLDTYANEPEQPSAEQMINQLLNGETEITEAEPTAR